MKHPGFRWYCCLLLFSAYSTGGFAQKSRNADVLGGPFAGPVMLNAPFSGDAVMTVTLAVADGAERFETKTKAQYYRDRQGRSRVEYVSPSVPTFIDLNPGDPFLVQILDTGMGKVHFFSRDMVGLGLGGNGSVINVPLGGLRFIDLFHADVTRRLRGLGEESVYREALGTRRIEGVEAVGTRITLTVPPYNVRVETGKPNTRPVTIVDEQWASPELGILVSVNHADPFGTAEYRLSNIRRADPAPALFVIPSEYSIVNARDDQRSPMVSMPPDAYRANGKLTR